MGALGKWLSPISPRQGVQLPPPPLVTCSIARCIRNVN